MRTEARTTNVTNTQINSAPERQPEVRAVDYKLEGKRFYHDFTLQGVPVSRHAVFAVLVIVLLGWDLYSKWWVFDTLGYELRQSDSWLVWLWGKNVFRLMTSFNHGALWGMGQGLSAVFASLSVVAVMAVLVWLFAFRGAQSWWLTVSLAFVTAGTLGNLYDRLGLHGLRNEMSGQLEYAVRDFMFFEIIRWPIFNFADTFLVAGAMMLLVQSFQAEMAAKQAVVSPAPLTLEGAKS
jgi:signal peptidase II